MSEVPGLAQGGIRLITDSEDIDLLIEGGNDILAALMSSPATVKQLAQHLGLSRARVQFIVDHYIEDGLIQLHHAAYEAGHHAIEHHYTLADKMAVLSLSGSPEHACRVMVELVEKSLRTNVASRTTLSETMLLKLVQSSISAQRAQEFLERLQQLAEEFHTAPEDSSGTTFAMLVGLYPIKDTSK